MVHNLIRQIHFPKYREKLADFELSKLYALHPDYHLLPT